jgi:hypothetical protein
MALPKDKNTLRDYPQQGSSDLTLEAFQERFIELLVAYNLDAKVKTLQIAAFFEIVEEHHREKASWVATRKAILLRDHRDCEKLIKGIRNRLKELATYLDKFEKVTGPLTASLARSSIKKIRLWKDLLSDQEAIIRSQRAVLSMIKDTVKNADRELTIDLLNLITEEFPDSTEKDKKDRDGLIGAALVAAGLYDEKTLAADAGAVERIPMTVSRAKKRIRRLYSVPGSERNNPSVIARRKKERLLRQGNEKGPVVQPVREKTK